MCVAVAAKSKDESTKCGCVIVGPDNEVRTTGYNGMTRGCDDNIPERSERPEKYFWYEHAERNAIYNAANNGIVLKGSTAYVTGAPCMDCARGLVQSGIEEVVWLSRFDAKMMENEKWKDSIERTILLFEETNVAYRMIDVTFKSPKIFVNGEIYELDE